MTDMRTARLRLPAIVASLFVGAVVVTCAARRPSNDRDWSVDQSVLPYAEIQGQRVVIHNVRNFSYQSSDRFTPAHDDRTYDLGSLDSVWFVVEPFGDWQGPAHTFLSFGFEGKEFIAISVEIRKEKGESFSAIGGLFRRYEVMYVIGDERDLIGLRANLRKDQVYLYQVHTTQEQMRNLFLSMLARANDLRIHPEFYNTLTNTCTTNIVRHVNAIVEKKIPLRLGIILPGYSDRLAYGLGLIDTSVPFDDLRERSRINDLAREFADASDFSRRIREMPSTGDPQP